MISVDPGAAIRRSIAADITARVYASDVTRRRREMNPELAYMAVIFLRKKGHKVRVAKRDPFGRETHHGVDGVIQPTSWMMDMARTYGWKPDYATSASVGAGRRGQ